MKFARCTAMLAMVLVAGCAGDGAKKPTQREVVRQQWNSARAGVLHSLAKQQYENGHFDACRKTLDEAMAMDPASPQLHLLSARLLIEHGQLERASLALDQARTLDPRNADADYLNGVIFQRWQKPEAALDSYEKAQQKAPTELAYLLARAEMLVTLDRREEALMILRDKLAFFENSPTIRDAVGQLLVQDGKPAEGARMFQQASILAPDDLSIREHLCLALYYAKDYREATLVFERLLSDERYRTRADLLTALGECHLQTGRLRDARDRFENAAQIQPGLVAIWLNLGKTAIQLNDFPRAELSARKALSLEPANPEVHLMLGYLRLHQNKLDEAARAFRKASALDQKDTVSLCMIGYVLEKQNRHDEAMACYAQALRIRPGDELATTLMAQVRIDD